MRVGRASVSFSIPWELGEEREQERAAYKIRHQTRARKRGQGPSTKGQNRIPRSSHDSAQTMVSHGGQDAAHQAGFHSKPLRQLPQALGVIIKVSTFCRLGFPRSSSLYAYM